MTKKEWYKLKLQVVLRKTIPSELILLKTGWCHKCKNYKGEIEKRNDADASACHHWRQKCKDRLIPTVDTDGIIIEYSWFSYYYPKKFDD